LCEKDLEATSALLATLGFVLVGREGNRSRFELPGGNGRVDVLHQPDADHGKMGAGMIHHIALRVSDEAEQLAWRDKLIASGLRVSPVKDRLYFHSIYFRHPGGTLFEIATDGPGFLIDEAEDSLGRRLCLPPWLEPERGSIEARLAPVKV
jgi:glyoxalase family protein